MQETLPENRMDLLKKQKKKNNKKVTGMPYAFVTNLTYVKGFRKQPMKYWNNIHHEDVCKKLFTTPPVITYS